MYLDCEVGNLFAFQEPYMATSKVMRFFFNQLQFFMFESRVFDLNPTVSSENTAWSYKSLDEV